MKSTIAYVILLVALFVGGRASAKVDVKVHFKMGQGTAVTYATAPERIAAENNEQLKLNRVGTPVFFASSPEGKAGGAVLFTPDNGYFHTSKKLVDSEANFVFEVWAKARIPERKDLDAKHTFGVAGIGDGKHGYNFVQQGDKWFVLVGGVGMFEVGTVSFNNWVHLAMVANGSSCTIWMNGEERGTFNPTNQLNAGFTVGNLGQGNNQFSGEVYEVRYGTFGEGEFNSNEDFLLNYKQVKEKKEHLVKAQKERIKNIAKPGLGRLTKDKYKEAKVEKDYLVHQVDQDPNLIISKSEDGMSAQLELTNGLLSRSFYVSENLACVSYKNLRNDAQYLRAVKPEARIKVDDRWIDVGGLTGQPEKSYLLTEWLPDMEANPNAWVLSGISTQKPEARYPWKVKFNARETEWPPKGLHLVLHFEAPESELDLKGLKVDVHYEIYNGIPVIAKWISIDNSTEKEIVVEETECEVLAVNQDQVKRIHVESNYSFALVNGHPQGSALLHYSGTPKPYHAGQTTTRWEVDPEYNTWATHNQAEDGYLGFRHENLLKSRLPMGPSESVKAGKSFQSFTTFELLFDGDDTERNSLAHRRMYRKLAPQVTESLITAAITSHDRDKLKNMIDQMAELGFERLDIHPWPGVAHDNLDPEYVDLWKDVASYAEERGIIMGGYELVIASRGRGAKVNCVDPETGKPGSLFGQSVCIASEWKDDYFKNVFEFFDKTGFKSWNADGPYHGDACASTEHKYHRGLEDSQWEQWKVQVDVLSELQRRNCYIPIPDWYFLNGQSATGMGYREATANLTPQQQLLLGRQYIYDGTWHKIPTMGWMTLQLVGFYSNDPRVGLEPLKDNLDRYERGLVQHLGSGCQFTVRGNRLYDTPETKQMVKKWVDWFKTYREVLTGDIIHLGRPNGRDLDCMMHVNPFGEDRAMAVVFNPTNKSITKKLKLPLYYAGVSKTADVCIEGGSSKYYSLNDKQEIEVELTIKPGGYTWVLVKDATSQNKEVVKLRWQQERIEKWKAQTEWLVGANFIPSTAINQVEMWSSATFDPKTIDRELGYAKDLGFNCMRVYLHELVWENDREGFISRIHQYLDMSDKHGIKTLFVFFDDCWQADPYYGPQPEPFPGRHNSYWLQSPGIDKLERFPEDETLQNTLKSYVQDVLTEFKNDQRIVGWDLYNEPGGWWRRPDNTRGQVNELCAPLLKSVFEWAREIDPSQPLTSGVFRSWGVWDPLVKIQLENSDIVSFHHYEYPENLKNRINWLKDQAKGRPLLCTEYMARPNSTFQTDLPIMKENGVGAINWGLVSGKIQTIYPWATWDDKTPREEPKVWFHDILRRNGKPFDKKEVTFIKEVTSQKKRYNQY